jgi:peptidoglycan/xylan/chitin deacetylase (PgdA/CDA1 family)
MYHAVVRRPLPVPHWCFLDAAAFRRQVRYLARRFDVVPLSEAVARLRSGSDFPATAVITLDDGFHSTFEVVYPILREERLPATLFLATGFIGTSDTVWFSRLHDALERTGVRALRWNAERFDLDRPEARARASALLRARLKRLPQPELLVAVREIVHAVGDDPDRAIEPSSPYRMLDRAAITEMSASGLIELGAHTHSHAILGRLPAAEQRAEIQSSVEAVVELTGRPCELFSYPNGRFEDFDDRTIRMLEASGIRAAVTAERGANDASTPLLRLRRLPIGPRAGRVRFRRLVLGEAA